MKFLGCFYEDVKVSGEIAEVVFFVIGYDGIDVVDSRHVRTSGF